MKRSLFTILAVLVVMTMIVAACAPTEAPPEPTEAPAAEPTQAEEPAAGDMPYAGETVVVFSAAGEEQAVVFEANFVDFEERTGIDVVVERSGDFETLAVVRSEAGDPYDILNFPQPGLMADMARDGFLVDLSEFIDQDYLLTKYNQSWIDMGTVDGALAGVWHGVDVKSLVWYPKAAFEAAGYTIPETWDDLIALSDQIVADGSVPWCIGIESSGATGWVGTDWVEDIMLRTQPVEKYDQWTTGELKFDSPEVRNAFDVMSKVWMNEDYVYGGVTSILTVPFGDSPASLFTDPPSCWLHRQASFIPNFFPEGTEIGVDVDYFYLPPIDPAYGKPVLTSGNLVSLAKDTPAGREVIKFMTTAESVKAEVEAGNTIAPHLDASLDWYPSDVQRGYAEILAGADTFRFDGSDLMPGAVGAGSFWTGIVDWVSGEDLDSVLAAIDASWPQ
jgi:alpha-glucoside transport system substrate-binding protein